VSCAQLQCALQYLDLSENNATNFSNTEGGGLALSNTLQDHPTLTVLNLSHNRLDRSVVVALAKALESNSVLVDLELEDNGVDPLVCVASRRVALLAPTSLGCSATYTV
jgi:Ran GTPase-activating protein (RanGAP) involved in mRNA processing and transport